MQRQPSHSESLISGLNKGGRDNASGETNAKSEVGAKIIVVGGVNGLLEEIVGEIFIF